MDHYAVLGLRPGAPIEEVRLQFRRLAMVFHPDRNSDDVWCQEQLKRLNASYAFLSDTERKAWYDASLPQRAGDAGLRQTADTGRRLAQTLVQSPPSSPSQRIFLSALFCLTVIGAVVIGILIGSGQGSDNSLPDTGTAFSPVTVRPAPVFAAPPDGGNGVGQDTDSLATGSPIWPSSLSGAGGQSLSGQGNINDPSVPFAPIPVPPGNWPANAPGYAAPAGR